VYDDNSTKVSDDKAFRGFQISRGTLPAAMDKRLIFTVSEGPVSPFKERPELRIATSDFHSLVLSGTKWVSPSTPLLAGTQRQGRRSPSASQQSSTPVDESMLSPAALYGMKLKAPSKTASPRVSERMAFSPSPQAGPHAAAGRGPDTSPSAEGKSRSLTANRVFEDQEWPTPVSHDDTNVPTRLYRALRNNRLFTINDIDAFHSVGKDSMYLKRRAVLDGVSLYDTFEHLKEAMKGEFFRSADFKAVLKICTDNGLGIYKDTDENNPGHFVIAFEQTAEISKFRFESFLTTGLAKLFNKQE